MVGPDHEIGALPATGDDSGFIDPLHAESAPTVHWTRANAEEIFPRAITHFTWSFVGPAGERGWRASFIDAGILPRSESSCPDDPSRRAWSIFFGRPAFNFDYLKYFAFAAFSSTDEEAQALRLAEGRRGRARRRLLTAANVAFLPRRLARLRAETERWWRDTVNPVVLRQPGRAEQGLREALAYYEQTSRLHVLNSVIPVAWAYARVADYARRAGVADSASTVLGGFDTLEEVRLAQGLWDVAHGRRTMADFLDAFGFHGPVESELSSRSWREDSQPVDDVLKSLGSAPADHEPRLAEARRRREQRQAWRGLLRRLPWRDRLWAAMVIALGRRYVPRRQVGKASLVQALDVARACARVLGGELCRRGQLHEPDDVFFLTVEEVLGSSAGHQRLHQSVVAWRKVRRRSYLLVDIPRDFFGVPVPNSVAGGIGAMATDLVLRGQGVSAGRVQGRARVLRRATDEVQPGEVLVAEFTDPGWTPLLVLAAAVVLDVGGSMSHGAIIARELGIPCVLGAAGATLRIATGDLVAVDGATGVVEIVERATPGTDHQLS